MHGKEEKLKMENQSPQCWTLNRKLNLKENKSTDPEPLSD